MPLLRSPQLAAAALLTLSPLAAAQSLLERSPNLSGAWLGATGAVQFNFTHRFSISDTPDRKVTNSPTFLLSYRLPAPLLVGMHYATSSAVGPAGVPNEFEWFLRGRTDGGPLDVGGQVGYNTAAKSVDAEVTVGKTAGRLRVVAVGRYLSSGYASDTARYAVGGGAVVRLGRHVALAGDAVTLFERRTGEEIAWGAGLHLAIPYSPHTFSLQVANTNTGTLQGASRGFDGARAGFEFTIPFTLSRYFGRRKAAEGGGGRGGAQGGAAVELRQMAFAPVRLEVSAGTSVTFTNRDPLVHTVTAIDGSWDSGPIEPGATWRRTFDHPGTYAFRCTPHPFMTGTIVVR